MVQRNIVSYGYGGSLNSVVVPVNYACQVGTPNIWWLVIHKILLLIVILFSVQVKRVVCQHQQAQEREGEQ